MAISDMILLIVIYRSDRQPSGSPGLFHRHRLEAAHRRFVVVVLIVTVSSQSTFLVIARMTWNALIRMDDFEMFTHGCLPLNRRRSGGRGRGMHFDG